MKIEIIALNSEDADPPKGGIWILIEEDSSGNWYGTGFSTNADGAEVIYISDSAADVSYNRSVAAALQWAEQHGVSVIYVRRL